MRGASPLRQKQMLPVLLLLIAVFSLGLWLGGSVLPESALTRLYPRDGHILGLTLPYAAPASATPAALIWLTAGGLPGAGEVMALAAALEAEAAEAETAEESILVVMAKQDEPSAPIAAPIDDEPKIIIYCTHAGENYAGETRVNGKAGGVLTAARALRDAFAALGVTALLDETIHDSPDYNLSYARSLETVERLAQAYPDIEVYIDVHRDSSIAGVSTRLTTDQGSYARMMLVAGSDESLEHPDWRENYSFIQAVSAEAENLQPGIMREPRLYNGRYNQHIANKALLVEVGSTDNDLDEACRSVGILAQAILNCL